MMVMRAWLYALVLYLTLAGTLWAGSSSRVECTVPDTGGPVMLSCTAPDGTAIPSEGSTTGGLEEGLRYACDHNLSHYIEGAGNGGILPVLSSHIDLSTTLDFRALRDATGSRAPCPIQGKSLHWDYVTLNWGGALASPAIILDSFMGLDWQANIQLVYGGTACVIHIVPTNPVPADQVIAGIDSQISVMTIGAQNILGPSECLIKLDAQYGPIVRTHFHWIEANGGGCIGCVSSVLDGLKLVNPSWGIINNHISGALHGFSGRGLVIGESRGDGVGIYANVFDHDLFPAGAGATGVLIHGRDNEYHLAIMSNEAQTTDFAGIKFGVGTSAADNLMSVRRNDALVKTMR